MNLCIMSFLCQIVERSMKKSTPFTFLSSSLILFTLQPFLDPVLKIIFKYFLISFQTFLIYLLRNKLIINPLYFLTSFTILLDWYFYFPPNYLSLILTHHSVYYLIKHFQLFFIFFYWYFISNLSYLALKFPYFLDSIFRTPEFHNKITLLVPMPLVDFSRDR